MQKETRLEQRKAIRCGGRVASDGGRDEERRGRQLGLEGEVLIYLRRRSTFSDARKRVNQTWPEK